MSAQAINPFLFKKLFLCVSQIQNVFFIFNSEFSGISKMVYGIKGSFSPVHNKFNFFYIQCL